MIIKSTFTSDEAFDVLALLEEVSPQYVDPPIRVAHFEYQKDFEFDSLSDFAKAAKDWDMLMLEEIRVNQPLEQLILIVSEKEDDDDPARMISLIFSGDGAKEDLYQRATPFIDAWEQGMKTLGYSYKRSLIDNYPRAVAA